MHLPQHCPRVNNNKKGRTLLSAFLTEKWQSQNFGRELVFSADLCYNGANEKPSSGRKVARLGFPEANEMSFGGSLRSVTEGACVTLGLDKSYCIALSLSQLR